MWSTPLGSPNPLLGGGGHVPGGVPLGAGRPPTLSTSPQTPPLGASRNRGGTLWIPKYLYTHTLVHLDTILV